MHERMSKEEYFREYAAVLRAYARRVKGKAGIRLIEAAESMESQIATDAELGGEHLARPGPPAEIGLTSQYASPVLTLRDGMDNKGSRPGWASHLPCERCNSECLLTVADSRLTVTLPSVCMNLESCELELRRDHYLQMK